MWNAGFYITEQERESRDKGIDEIGTSRGACCLEMNRNVEAGRPARSGTDLVPVGMAAYLGVRCAG